jgi:hypothetical protein
MNFKVIFIGGVVYYAALWIVSMATGHLVHEVLLDQIYRDHEGFWRPELNMDPPDMGALMPRWIATGLLGAFVISGIYDKLRGAYAGSPAVRGLKFGFTVALLQATIAMGWSGIFNLPDSLWLWWTLDSLAYYALGGAVLGWITEKLSPAG